MVSIEMSLVVLRMSTDLCIGCTDCLCACCCGPCDLAQQDKEIEFREGGMAQQINVQPSKMETMHYPEKMSTA
jgi:hypothetical protein